MRQIQAHLGKIAIAILLALCAWGWFFVLEEHTISKNKLSPEALRNPMLAAGTLLTKRGYQANEPDMLQVRISHSLNGTMLIMSNHAMMTEQRFHELLGWVERGNTLILKPRRANTGATANCSGGEEEPAIEMAKAAEGQKDRIGRHFATASVGLKRPHNQDFHCISEVLLPGKSRSLRVETRDDALRSVGTPPTMPLIDTNALRLFRHGSGHVVFVADDLFSNNRLAWNDHGELLLSLVELQPTARHVTFVKWLTTLHWHQALWRNFPHAVIGIALFLCLLFWRAVRRFGPVENATESERRSLIEHVEASGRWLWSVPNGRELLIGAVRRAVEKAVLHARPELRGLDVRERTALLAAACSIPAEQLHHALHGPAAAAPAEFAHQVRILQRLKRHHE